MTRRQTVALLASVGLVILLGIAAATPRAAGRAPVATKAAAAPISESPTVEIIRGDKRAHELVRQEPQ